MDNFSGIVLRKAVRHAIGVIRDERFCFTTTYKAGQNEQAADPVTSADLAAQKAYVEAFKLAFPHFGIVAEEDDVRIPCEASKLGGKQTHLTIDGMDGTRAFLRRQSHGIGTMVSLVCDEKVIAAYIGDVMTQEMYGFEPGSDHVVRIDEHERCTEVLKARLEGSLKDAYCLLRDEPESYAPVIQHLVKKPARNRLCAGYEVGGGSIGLSMARLWNNEGKMVVISGGCDTPWDMTPIYGICTQLGYTHFEVSENGRELVHTPFPKPTTVVGKNRRARVFVHQHYVPEVLAWQAGLSDRL